MDPNKSSRDGFSGGKKALAAATEGQTKLGFSRNVFSEGEKSACGNCGGSRKAQNSTRYLWIGPWTGEKRLKPAKKYFFAGQRSQVKVRILKMGSPGRGACTGKKKLEVPELGF